MVRRPVGYLREKRRIQAVKKQASSLRYTIHMNSSTTGKRTGHTYRFAIERDARGREGISRDTIYTLKLRRRGIGIMRGRSANLMEILTVADAMRALPNGVPQSVTLNELIARFTEEECDALPVVDKDGAFRGAVTLQEVEQAVRDNALDVVAGDLARTAPALYANQSLERALGLLVHEDRSGLPVLAADQKTVSGWVTQRDVLRAYNERLEQSLTQVERRATRQPAIAERGPRGVPPYAPEAADGPPVLDGDPLLSRLRGYRIVDLELTGERAPVGRRVMEIAWPPSSLVVAVRRGAGTFAPNGQTELLQGDRLTVLVPARHAEGLADTICEEPIATDQPSTGG